MSLACPDVLFRYPITFIVIVAKLSIFCHKSKQVSA